MFVHFASSFFCSVEQRSLSSWMQKFGGLTIQHHLKDAILLIRHEIDSDQNARMPTLLPDYSASLFPPVVYTEQTVIRILSLKDYNENKLFRRLPV